MADPVWNGMTEYDQANWQNYDPQFLQNVMASQAAGTMPTAQAQEAGRQETAQVLNTPYNPTSFAQPAGRSYGNDSIQMDGPGRPGMTGGWGNAAPRGPSIFDGAGGMPWWAKGGAPQMNYRGDDAVNMDDPYFKPMGPDSIGGYSTADHQLIGRQAGYTGEFGNGLFEAAMVADPSLRERFNAGVDRFSQNAQAPMGQMPFGSNAPNRPPLGNYPGTNFPDYRSVQNPDGSYQPGYEWLYGAMPSGNFLGDQQQTGFGQIDFGFGGQQPYAMPGQQQGALNPYPTAGYDRGAFEFARGGRVR